jgi:formyltetrahydrofolate deformylase
MSTSTGQTASATGKEPESPATAASKPRGVKLIRATAHYVTTDLDEGPIIEQEVERVDHTQSPEDLTIVGSELETVVLNRAIKWHAERLVFGNGGRTVVLR